MPTINITTDIDTWTEGRCGVNCAFRTERPDDPRCRLFTSPTGMPTNLDYVARRNGTASDSFDKHPLRCQMCLDATAPQAAE